MLPISIERNRMAEAHLLQITKTSLERGAFSTTGPPAQAFRAGFARNLHRGIRRTVIDDEDRGQKAADLSQQLRQCGRLISARNQGGIGIRFAHANSLSRNPSSGFISFDYPKPANCGTVRAI